MSTAREEQPTTGGGEELSQRRVEWILSGKWWALTGFLIGAAACWTKRIYVMENLSAMSFWFEHFKEYRLCTGGHPTLVPVDWREAVALETTALLFCVLTVSAAVSTSSNALSTYTAVTFSMAGLATIGLSPLVDDMLFWEFNLVVGSIFLKEEVPGMIRRLSAAVENWRAKRKLGSHEE